MSMNGGKITAVLGPTNTGKTHYAIDRMLSYRTGMIGLPLRLLAREVYDRIVALRGPSVVALITGEERIVPDRVAYWVCTTEAMPPGMGVDFLAIDEIQLAADPERGHVFTDRMLHFRGLHETLLLGSRTMWGMLSKLVPEADFVERARFSELTYSGSRKISRMRPRSAIVGFSAENVYGIAELIRRQKGGAAVVLGALSPRTRNAQVDLYQNGDVDYLVATDAIGLGLNLDIDHIGFSAHQKFDGRRMRDLMPNELAQIAGRAGRHTTAGTFGVTGEAPEFTPQVVDAIENNRFAPVARVQWRNSTFNFGSVDALVASLEARPDRLELALTRDADDLIALKKLIQPGEVASDLTDAREIRLLWEVCSIPDFRGISADEHAQLLAKILDYLRDGGKIPDIWIAAQLKRLDRPDGDIDTLSKRLAFVRTWTYVSERNNWLEDQHHWRGEARATEDRLSDALHAALTQRFVDRRTSVLLRRLKQKESLVAEVTSDGEVKVEGELIGRLEGFRFSQDKASTPEEAATLRATSLAALAPEFNLRSDRFYNAPDTEIDFTEQGGLMWGEHAVGKLVAGPSILEPEISVFVDDEAGPDVAEKIKRRLKHFMDRKTDQLFEPVIGLRDDEAVTGLARGVAFQIVEALGILNRATVAEDVKSLDQDARGLLRKHGVRFGQYTIFLPLLLKPAATRLRLVLWSLKNGHSEFPAAPPAGLVTVPCAPDAIDGYYLNAGYRPAGDRAVRVDMLERLADLLRVENARSGFEATPDMLSITGMTLAQFSDLMGGLGYAAEEGTREKQKALPDAAPSDANAADETPTKTAVEPTSDEGPIEPEAETATAEPEEEVFYTFKWVPKKRPAQQNARPKPKTKGDRDKKSRKPEQTKKMSAGPKAKEKPIDPDNPFAALMSLKENL